MSTHQDPPTLKPEDCPLPPGSDGFPLIGETLDYLQGVIAFTESRRKKHGDIFRTNILGSKTVILLGPEANQWNIANMDKLLKNKWTPGMRTLLGAQSVTFLEGQEHLGRRRLLAPHFTYAAMRGFIPSLEALATHQMQQWAAQKDGIVLWDAMRNMVFQTMLTLVFGEDPIDTGFLLRHFHLWSSGLFTLFTINLPFMAYGKAIASKKAIMDYLEQRIVERQKRAEQPADLLGSLIDKRDEAGNPLPIDTIKDEILVLLFAGQDTTITAVCNLIMLLTKNPEQLARARQELAAVPQPLSLESLRGTPYLMWLIFEGMRRITPVPAVLRSAAKDLVYKGYRIPEGWTVLLNIEYSNVSDAWTKPLEFDPDRFSPERNEQKLPGLYIPFGGGHRICVGQHFAMVDMSIILTMLLKHYEWELLPGQDLTYTYLPFARPKSGARMKFRPLPPSMQEEANAPVGRKAG